MTSAVQHPGPVEQYLSSKKEAGRIAGPFTEQDVPVGACQSFGVIPKSGRQVAPDHRLVLSIRQERERWY